MASCACLVTQLTWSMVDCLVSSWLIVSSSVFTMTCLPVLPVGVSILDPVFSMGVSISILYFFSFDECIYPRSCVSYGCLYPRSCVSYGCIYPRSCVSYGCLHPRSFILCFRWVYLSPIMSFRWVFPSSILCLLCCIYPLSCVSGGCIFPRSSVSYGCLHPRSCVSFGVYPLSIWQAPSLVGWEQQGGAGDSQLMRVETPEALHASL